MNPHKTLLVALSFCILNINNAQGLTASVAYDSASSYRDAAANIAQPDSLPPTKANLLKAIAILNSGLAYLQTPAVHDLIQGDIYLKYRRFNILNDIAHMYSLLRCKDSTIETLKTMFDVGSYEYGFVEADTAFDFIRNEEGYKHLIAVTQLTKALWQGEALKTPYRDDLPLNEKIAGLSLLWSQAKYNFVHFAHAGIDWNKQYLDYIDMVSQTKSTAEYYKVLIKFYASLKDGHTNVYYPKELQSKFYARPPFRTALVDRRVFVTEIYSDTLQKMGIEKGLEILEIDGQPVLEYAKNNVEPYASSSTPQDMEIRKFTYGLLSGSKDVPLQIKFRNNQGKEWVQSVPRSGYPGVKNMPTFSYSEINNIGYLQLNSFEDDNVKDKYDSIFGSLQHTKALIIDLRKNGGGSDDIGFHILSTLTDSPYAISVSRVTQYNSLPNGDAQWYSFEPGKVNPSPQKMNYSKPVILLISARTFSAAEDFVVDFSYMKRGKMIGQTTGGSTGSPLAFDLPGGGTARVCAKDDVFPDGKIFVGVGIKPDIYISNTVDDVYNGNDAVLAKALELLK